MESFEQITDYISQFLTLTNQIKIYGKVHTDKNKVQKILPSLTTLLEHFVVEIEEPHSLCHKQHMNRKHAEKPIKDWKLFVVDDEVLAVMVTILEEGVIKFLSNKGQLLADNKTIEV